MADTTRSDRGGDDVAPIDRCPCGCGTHVPDQGGWFIGMTRYAQAALPLLDRMKDLAEGPLAERIAGMADDTSAIIDLLVEWCHDATDLGGTTQIYALTSIWEKEFTTLAASFELLDSDAYRRWLGETTPQRAMRHGPPRDLIDEDMFADIYDIDLEVEDVEW